MAQDPKQEFFDIISMALSQAASTEELIDFSQLYGWKTTRQGRRLVCQLEQDQDLQREILHHGADANAALDRILGHAADELVRRYGPK